MKRVLWISRHKPLPAQIKYLEQKLGEFELLIWSKPLSTAKDAIELALKHSADYVIPVLPLSFIQYLVMEAKKYGITVLKADMQNLHNCEVQPCPEYDPKTDTIMESRDMNTGQKIYRHFRFRGFKILKDIIIVEEDW